MSKPMTSTQFVNLLDEWGIPHRENRPNWQNHNRGNRSDGWGITDRNPGGVRGIANHHTGGKDNQAGRNVLWYGYEELPGPLCHAGIQTDGYVLLNGWGRTNHAGLGDSDVLASIISEKYTGRLYPKVAKIDGNARFYGFEWMYEGTTDPTKLTKLYNTAVRVNAAICTFHKWSEKSSFAHGEWQPGKWDPGMARGELFNVVAFRNHVQQAIKEGPKQKTPAKKEPLPARPANPVTPKRPTVKVKKGDTLISLSKEHLGDSARWTDIVAANPTLVRPLNVGEELFLPKK